MLDSSRASEIGRGGCVRSGMDCLLRNLAACPGILSRKFKTGEPCGDTLKAILDGQDGSRNIPPRIFNRLRGIGRLVETMDPTTMKAKLAVGFCFNCRKNGNAAEARLSVCSGCRFAQYCSKECQTAHWKIHKPLCQSIGGCGKEFWITLVECTHNFFVQNLETVSQTMD